MGKTLTALAISALAAGPAAASDKTDVIAVLHQWIDGFSKGGDMKTAIATCAEQGAVIDSIPPHEWHGAGACSKWLADFNAFIKANDTTDVSGKLGKIKGIDVTGDRAYVVAPLTLSFKVKGKAMKETGAVWTVALQKGAAGWRITGWSYSAGTDVEVKTAAAK